MTCKLAMFLGLSALMVVLMVDPADSACCRASGGGRSCSGWFWKRRCTVRPRVCADGTRPTPYCGYGKCNIFGCNCRGGCRRSRGKRDVAEDVRSLLELVRGDQEDIAPEENAMAGRGFGDHDKDKDHMLNKQEALDMLRLEGEVDVDNLPAGWFEEMDKNKNGYIDPEEFDEDMAKTEE